MSALRAWLGREIDRLCDALADGADHGYGYELLPGLRSRDKERTRNG